MSAKVVVVDHSRTGRSEARQLREVVVCDAAVDEAASTRSVEIRTASGHVVRGLSIADAAALLKALS